MICLHMSEHVTQIEPMEIIPSIFYSHSWEDGLFFSEAAENLELSLAILAIWV
jgi:hypothetical protein